MWLEKKGIPTVTVVTQPFHEPARLSAVSMGVPNLPLVVLPHPVADLTPEELGEMARKAYPHIVAALTRKGPDTIDFIVDYQLPDRRADSAECEVCVD